MKSGKSCTSQNLLMYRIFFSVISEEIRKKNPEFSFSALNMYYFDIENVFAGSF